MADETDPTSDLEKMLQELDEQGELDSEEITFKTMSIGAVHLDKLDTALEKIDYERDPVRITIEPESDQPEDHHYRIEFDDLEHNDRGQLVPTDVKDRVEGLVDELCTKDCIVPSEVHDAPNVGYNKNGYVVFDVEAVVEDVDGIGRGYTEWYVPDSIYELVDTYGGEVRDVTCHPKGRGWGEPTFSVEVVIE